MKQVILDTSFILTCAKQKIDFFDKLELSGFQIIIPKQVIAELTGLAKSNLFAKLSLKILEKNSFKEKDLETKNTDEGIIKFAKKDITIYVATLDEGILKKTRNRKILIRGKRSLEFF